LWVARTVSIRKPTIWLFELVGDFQQMHAP
jgi:hypothetical protein